MIYVSRKEHFNASHRLYNPHWSKEKNEETFGLCANEHGHGHNFELIVTVKGELDADTGFVIDLKKLSTLIRSKIIDRLDHKHLNFDVDFMKDKLTSCENLIMAIWDILEPSIEQMDTPGILHSLTLYETPRNYVEYYGT